MMDISIHLTGVFCSTFGFYLCGAVIGMDLSSFDTAAIASDFDN